MPAMALTRQHVGAQNPRRRSCPEIAGHNPRSGILERRLDVTRGTADNVSGLLDADPSTSGEVERAHRPIISRRGDDHPASNAGG